MKYNFDIGQEIYCIDNCGGNNRITLFKKYIVLNIEYEGITLKVKITNDDDMTIYYYGWRFTSLQGFRKLKLNELLNE